MRVGVVHGPNLNLLGRRQPDRYGNRSLEEIEEDLREAAAECGAELVTRQSNSEGALVDWIQSEADGVGGWVVNAGGLTHSSVALRDALLASGRPFVEVHLSNIYGREAFRRKSLLADAALGIVVGFGPQSYRLGLRGLLVHLADAG